jgi:glycosidase
MFYPGSPMFFYGDEAGMWGANDPDCRKPMVWADKQYDPETFNPDQSRHDPDEVRFDPDLFNWYKKLIGLRRKYKSLRLGNYTTVAIDDERKLYAFRRQLGKEEVIVVINRSDKPLTFTHAALQRSKYKNLMTRRPIGKSITINAMDFKILGHGALSRRR